MSSHTCYLIINAFEKFLSVLEIKYGKSTAAEMGDKQAIEIS